MIDRAARDQLAEALRSYMDERTTAFQFDGAIGKVKTKDGTARSVATSLWFNCRQRRLKRASKSDAFTPFPSFGSLRAVRRRVPAFARTRYPGVIAARRIRSPIVYAVSWVPWIIVWLALGPLALLVPAFPESRVVTRVRVPES
jgi:hypothetical protein